MEKLEQIAKVDAALEKAATGALKKVVAFGFICGLMIMGFGKSPIEQKAVEAPLVFLVSGATFCFGALMAALCFKSFIRLPTADLSENRPMSKADRRASITLIVMYVLLGALIAFLMQIITASVLDDLGFKFAVLGQVLGAWWLVVTFLACFDEREKQFNQWP